MEKRKAVAVVLFVSLLMVGGSSNFAGSECISVQVYPWQLEVDGMDAPPGSYYVEQAAAHWMVDLALLCGDYGEQGN